MATEEKPEGEAPEVGKETEKETKPEVEKHEEEPFDKDRAMNTIHTLREVEKQAKKDAKELADLKAADQKRKDAELSETERLTKENAETKAENVRIKADLLRREVISEVGLPNAFKDRLKGETKEELTADAQDLLRTVPALKQAPKLPKNNPPGGDPSETDAEKRERLFGKRPDIFNIDQIKQAGGGVSFEGSDVKVGKNK
jgi:hypothetical protein